MQKTCSSLKDLLKKFLEEKLKKESYLSGMGFAWTETDEICYDSVYSLINDFGKEIKAKIQEYDSDPGGGTDTWSKFMTKLDGTSSIIRLYNGNGVIEITVI